MKKGYLFLLFVFLLTSCKAQNVDGLSNDVQFKEPSNKSKLIVGIVVDQMRYDYLKRFESKYSEGGFRRMMKEGYNCKNNHFNYIPTKTGPGHASIFTGTTPKYHGIIGNDWYDKNLRTKVNCVQDDNVNPIGTENIDSKKSPARMLSTTFADENRLFTQMRGKTIGISIKHRGAILPAGHTANAAYWFDYKGSGNWVTSSFYMNELPIWVKDFNESDKTETYFKTWNTYYDIKTYTESGSDLNAFEGGFNGKETATFPYDLNDLKEQNENYKIIAESPFGNSLTTDFAIEAIENEGLGQDNIADVLTISYSSTDKVGHNFGVNSKEIEDTYIRLDLDLKRLFETLDEKVGYGQYTVFLTGDHAAPNVPSYLKSERIPSGLFDEKKMRKELNDYLLNKYSESELILSRINNQLFLDHEKISLSKIDLQTLKKDISRKLLTYDLIDKVYITSVLNHFEGPEGYLENLLKNGHNQKRSGDIVFVYEPGVFKDTPWNRTGTDHHSGFNYDTHVPLLIYGPNIKNGSTFKKTNITDLAPTISALMGISLPNGAVGEPLEFVFKK